MERADFWGWICPGKSAGTRHDRPSHSATCLPKSDFSPFSIYALESCVLARPKNRPLGRGVKRVAKAFHHARRIIASPCLSHVHAAVVARPSLSSARLQPCEIGCCDLCVAEGAEN